MKFTTTSKKQILDITDDINEYLHRQGFSTGLCHVHILHTTAALTTADLDPGTDEDMLDAFDGMIPDLEYRHPHDPSHVGDHIMSSMIGSDVTLPVRDGQLALGQWQRLVLAEFSGPREREVVVSLFRAD